MKPWDDAFAAFVRDRITRLVLFIIKCGASRDEAENAVQEALTKAYDSWPVIDNPEAWVRTTARRDFVKARLRDVHVLDRVIAGHEPVAEAGGLDSLVVTGDEERRIMNLLGLLPLRQREVLALDVDGYTTAEIAEMLDMAQSTVRSNRRHARSKMMEMLVPTLTDQQRHIGNGEAVRGDV